MIIIMMIIIIFSWEAEIPGIWDIWVKRRGGQVKAIYRPKQEVARVGDSSLTPLLHESRMNNMIFQWQVTLYNYSLIFLIYFSL